MGSERHAAVLKQVHTGYVRHVCRGVWSTSANTNRTKPDKVQNWGLRMILGAMGTTPFADMEKTTDIEPLENRRNTKILIHSEKMRRLALHSRLSEKTRNRLKRKNLNHLAKDLREPLSEILWPHNEPREQLAPERWQRLEQTPDIRTTIPGIAVKDAQILTAQCALALEFLEQEYPTKTWIQAYTDGSATELMPQ